MTRTTLTYVPAVSTQQAPVEARLLEALGQRRVRHPAVALAGADELQGDHEPQAPDIADGGPPSTARAQAVEQLGAARPRVRHQAFLLDDVQRGEGGRAGNDVAAVRAAVRARWEPVHQVRAGQDPRQGQAGRDALGHDQDVRLDVPVTDREQLAGPPEACLDLVGDQQDPVLPRDLAQAGQEPGRRHDVAALAETGSTMIAATLSG